MNKLTKDLAEALRDGTLAGTDVKAPDETDGAAVSRILGMADQFIEDWRDDQRDVGVADPDLDEREREWAYWRPRIVACVNACAGMSTEQLEELDNGQLADIGHYWLRDSK